MENESTPLVQKSYGSVPRPVKTDSMNLPKSSPISMIIVALCVFLGDSARGIYFPTMWLNVQRCGGNQAIQGMVVASFSLGRIITSPYLGALSEKMGHKFVLTISNSVILLGCFLYANASSIPSLIISQIIVGFGSGTLGVTRSYVAETSPKEHRTSYMAYLTATQYTGFTVMPLLGGYLALYGKKLCSSGNCKWLIFEMNEFSFPAYFMMAMAAIIIFLVVFVFQDYKKDPTSASSTKKKTISEIEAAKETDTCESCGITGMTLANELAIGGCLLNIATKGNIRLKSPKYAVSCLKQRRIRTPIKPEAAKKAPA